MSWRIYKRGRLWWCSVPGGDRVSTKCTDKKAAELWVREEQRRRADPAYAASQEVTLERACVDYLKERKAKGRADATLSLYRCKVGHLVRVLGADRPLAQVTAKAVDAYVATRLNEGASRSTVAKELAALRGTLFVARRLGHFSSDPTAVLPIGFSPEYEPRTRWLTWREVEMLLDALPPRRAATVAFAIGTGARLGEVFRARVEDLDLAAGVVRLRGTKTKAAARSVPALPLFRPLLERARRDAEGTQAGERLHQPWGNALRDLRSVTKRLGIKPVTWNDMRRTFATLLRAQGVEPHLLGVLLGHTTSEMVERIYGRLEPRELAELLAERMGGK